MAVTDDMTARTRRAPTSADVARIAGVSRAAVSVAFSGRGGSTRVSDETRRRILAVAEEIGYTPHPGASALRRQKSMVVLFVTRPARREPYEQVIPYLLSTETTSTLAERGYLTLVVQPEELGGADDVVSLIRRYRAGGVILDSPRTADVRAVGATGVPCVVLMRVPEDDLLAAAVTVDPRPGMEAAVSHLVGFGHRAIGFVAHGGSHPVDLGRIESYRHAVRAQGLESGTIELVDDYSIESGRGAAARLLAAEARITAIVTSSDGLTLGVLRHLYERRRRVPDEISVVSFDDAAVSGLYPPVTSIAQPFEEVARAGADLLLHALETGEALRGETRLPTSLVVRASTAASPGRKP